MKLLQVIMALILTVIMSGCSQLFLIESYNGPEILKTTDFCKLDEIKSGEFISTIAYYSGVEEYWGLSSNRKCELDHHVYLNSEGNHQRQLNKRLDKKVDRLYSNYWKYSLELRIIGKLEKTNEQLGYGHWGLKKIQINPYQIEILGKRKKEFEE